MIMAPKGIPIPMPTLAESERPDDDAGEEVGVAAPELVGVLVESRDASAVDAELEMGKGDATIVLEPDAVDVEGWDVTIEACPSVKRSEDSLQQLSPPSFSQHQVPEDSGGHAIIRAPPLEWPMFA